MIKQDKKAKPEDLSYPPSEDIYERFEEETEIDPEDPGRTKIPVWPVKGKNISNLEDDLTGEDLDIPEYAVEYDGPEEEENAHFDTGDDNHSEEFSED